jgi:hypothetical protein
MMFPVPEAGIISVVVIISVFHNYKIFNLCQK